MTNTTEATFSKQHNQLFADTDWRLVESQLNAYGYAVLPNLLDRDSCAEFVQSYENDAFYRSTIKMERYSFGKGEYRYFGYPLPNKLAVLRRELYPELSRIANRWNSQLGIQQQYPETHTDYIEQCHSHNQTRPTPLILRYSAGDYNCLHQDLYGDMVFPLQLAIMLSEPEKDFTGGEFILTEQRPRMQSRAEAVPLKQGSAIIFPVNERPVKGARGYYRVKMRHGVSRVRSGERYVLGIIFHDAK